MADKVVAGPESPGMKISSSLTRVIGEPDMPLIRAGVLPASQMWMFEMVTRSMGRGPGEFATQSAIHVRLLSLVQQSCSMSMLRNVIFVAEADPHL